jgi:hypothetical protein
MRVLTKTNLLFLAICFLSAQVVAQNFPEVIAVRKVQLKPETNPVEFQNSMKALESGLNRFGKGLSAQLWYGDRGERKGEYLHTWIFELKANRDYYFPTPDEASYPKLDALYREMGGAVDPVDPRVEDGSDNAYTDYVVLGFNDMDSPKWGDVLAFREVEVKSGLEKEFEAFATDMLHPMMQQHIDGMYSYILKGDRGERKGKYLFVYCFQSYEVRNRYFPEEGGEGSEAYAEALKDLSGIDAQLQSFLVEGSDSSYTDYLIVR